MASLILCERIRNQTCEKCAAPAQWLCWKGGIKLGVFCSPCRPLGRYLEC